MDYRITGGQLIINKKALGEMFLIPNHPLITIIRHMSVAPDRISAEEMRLDFNFKKVYEFNEVTYEKLKALLNEQGQKVKGNMVITCVTTHVSLYTTIEF